MPFHHDPGHDDEMLDRLFAEISRRANGRCAVLPAREDLTVDVASLVGALADG
jgi:hypothetical protein